MSSLKAELRGETLPPFSLAIPEGWVRREPTDEARREMLAAAKARLMAAHRPDLYTQTMSMVARMFDGMRRAETVAFFGPAPGAPDSAFLPATLTASIRRGESGGSLDSTVAHLVRSEGATALDEDKRFLRWRRESIEDLDGTSVATTTVVYLTPVPDSDRARALQFTLVISHDPSAEGDTQFVAGLEQLFDAHLSTFSWTTE